MPYLGLSLAKVPYRPKGCHRSIGYSKGREGEGNYFYGFRASRREWLLGRGLFATMEVISILFYFHKRSVQPIILTNEK